MNWKNDGKPAPAIELCDGVELTSFPKLEGALSAWLEIISTMDEGDPYGILGNEEFYKKAMTDMANYRDDKCFFLTVKGTPAATVTVITDDERRHGYVHMVCVSSKFRGMGLGKVLSKIAERELKCEGMETAHLTTDDYRIPAIKTYLSIGFTPDLDSQPDFKERWEKILKSISAT